MGSNPTNPSGDPYGPLSQPGQPYAPIQPNPTPADSPAEDFGSPEQPGDSGD